MLGRAKKRFKITNLSIGDPESSVAVGKLLAIEQNNVFAPGRRENRSRSTNCRPSATATRITQRRQTTGSTFVTASTSVVSDTAIQNADIHTDCKKQLHRLKGSLYLKKIYGLKMCKYSIFCGISPHSFEEC